MTCDQAMGLVEKLADGEATPAERGEAEAHIEGCENCRSHYEFVLALESASERIDWPEPPDAYWQHLPSKVRARLERGREPKSFWHMLFAPAVLRFGAVAATLTVVVAVGFSVLRDEPSRLEPSIAPAPASAGKQQADDKLAVADEPVAASELEAAADMAPPPAAGLPSVPSEEGFGARAEVAAPERAPAVAPAPATPPAQLAPEEFDDELAEREPTWDVANPAGLEGGVAPAEPASGRENRARLVESPEVAGQAVQAVQAVQAEKPKQPTEADVETEEASEARFARRSLASSAAVERCAEWRAYVQRNEDEGSESLEGRYQVAVCSLREYETEPSDERRERALRDVDSFLALESEGERAEQVRRQAAELRQ